MASLKNQFYPRGRAEVKRYIWERESTEISETSFANCVSWRVVDRERRQV